MVLRWAFVLVQVDKNHELRQPQSPHLGWFPGLPHLDRQIHWMKHFRALALDFDFPWSHFRWTL